MWAKGNSLPAAKGVGREKGLLLRKLNCSHGPHPRLGMLGEAEPEGGLAAAEGVKGDWHLGPLQRSLGELGMVWARMAAQGLASWGGFKDRCLGSPVCGDLL